jgi:hypothetical protein
MHVDFVEVFDRLAVLSQNAALILHQAFQRIGTGDVVFPSPPFPPRSRKFNDVLLRAFDERNDVSTLLLRDFELVERQI